MRLVQFELSNGERRVGVVDGERVHEVLGAGSVRELAMAAIEAGLSLVEQVDGQGLGANHDYAQLLQDLRILPPLDHPDPAHVLVSGTGLTHLGSASTRDKMHQHAADDASLTDSMRIFQWGLEGGKPAAGVAGVQPEWFYKGDGSIIVRPGHAFALPPFAEDAGEEPELSGLYVIGHDRKPYRLGFAIGNEFSDHVMERKNYLYLAHSKLRACSFGPELRVGALPKNLSGTSRIRRNGEVLWEKEFLSGEANMCHSFENLEYHHFKYNQFLNPGDIHVHFFGTATLSFADGVRTQPGDQFEISQADFGAPLINGIAPADAVFEPGQVKAL
ncbi:GguC family protein [Pseudomonas sp. CCI3.2]|uniref:AraD1 family protein n=1 Tax=unclassified Pseudomonas TaxID=196821 RepID=UPI002AC90CFC|nr:MULTISPECIES: AraD1 family protein [unclassified Pseudomonas]MEB0080154.1 GguC family protein [Pseudomonas sp. MH10out]MEB0104113.1 GguC family protein [Pseudomonas sp. CCI3.2]MEB0133292.1 GguC family protein [Pseudomonas sp. CCI2.4]MEB0160460.1 GguC family protein [Pseudomonas sp. AH2 (2023)]MEB0170025.1 GguC family protein [Pseudomonas sp. CCC4.4]